MRGLFDWLGALAIVAGVTTVVAHPASADVIKSAGGAIAGSLLAAQGYKS